MRVCRFLPSLHRCRRWGLHGSGRSAVFVGVVPVAATAASLVRRGCGITAHPLPFASRYPCRRHCTGRRCSPSDPRTCRRYRRQPRQSKRATGSCSTHSASAVPAPPPPSCADADDAPSPAPVRSASHRRNAVWS
ncbi:hypothetical protein, unknown function [Leishmania tarentolae]|uniref:Uncharacterized protein n=1 Tax=Leishmania tarentolae TaxID=5689 RepID=A0A640KAR5_LEITA|nr:hypothetical protein, unknown function [Leishmania tarentolae]